MDVPIKDFIEPGLNVTSFFQNKVVDPYWHIQQAVYRRKLRDTKVRTSYSFVPSRVETREPGK